MKRDSGDRELILAFYALMSGLMSGLLLMQLEVVKALVYAESGGVRVVTAILLAVLVVGFTFMIPVISKYNLYIAVFLAGSVALPTVETFWYSHWILKTVMIAVFYLSWYYIKHPAKYTSTNKPSVRHVKD